MSMRVFLVIDVDTVYTFIIGAVAYAVFGLCRLQTVDVFQKPD